MAEQKAYFAIIPANVRYDKDLPPNAKLLYGEITALCNEKGYCWAENRYFADLYGVSKTSVSKWIGALQEKGYIQTALMYREGSKEIDKRYITIVNDPMEKNLNTPLTKVNGPMEEKLKENSTSNNTPNKTSNKKERKKEDAQSATSYDEILSEIENETLRDTYYDFIKMRTLIKSPMTDRALKQLIKKVNELEPNSTERQIKVLEQSILNNWKGVFALKDESEVKDGGRNERPAASVEPKYKIGTLL